MTTPASFVASARALHGTPWRHRGRTSRGIDCVGLLVVSATQSGFLFEDEMTKYGREPWDDRLRKGLRERLGAPYSVAQAQVGDVALIRWGTGEPSHVGIIGDHPDGGLTLIHAHLLRGVIEQGLRDRIRDVVIEVYRPNWSAMNVN